jgi:tetratricopeptide (TPR) repeat protein
MSILRWMLCGDFNSNRADGDAHFEAGRWGEAKLAYENALSKGKKETVDALSHVASRINECRRKLAAGHAERAEELLRAGDANAAMDALEDAVEVVPDGPEKAVYLERRDDLDFGNSLGKVAPGTSDGPSSVRIILFEPILPIDRGVMYEEPLDELLHAEGLGEVTGGGTQLGAHPGEIAYADIWLDLTDVERALPLIHEFLERVGAPKGTKLCVAGREEVCGSMECLALIVDAARAREQPDDWFGPMVQQLLDATDQPCQARNLQSYRDGSLAAYLYAPDAGAVWRDIQKLVGAQPAFRGAQVIVRHGLAPESIVVGGGQ